MPCVCVRQMSTAPSLLIQTIINIDISDFSQHRYQSINATSTRWHRLLTPLAQLQMKVAIRHIWEHLLECVCMSDVGCVHTRYNPGRAGGSPAHVTIAIIATVHCAESMECVATSRKATVQLIDSSCRFIIGESLPPLC